MLCLAVPGQAEQAGNVSIHLLEADGSGATLELTVAVHTVVPLPEAGESYQLIDIPGMEPRGETGTPQLPATGTLVGLPDGMHMVATVVDAEYQEVRDIRIPPIPSLRIPADPAAGVAAEHGYAESASYRANRLLPGPLTSVGFTGALRGLPVAQLLFHPVQFNPATGTARVYHRIRVDVRFVPDTPPASALAKAGGPDAQGRRAGAAGGRFGPIMQQAVINYHAVGD